jgi:hypothetical protein
LLRHVRRGSRCVSGSPHERPREGQSLHSLNRADIIRPRRARLRSDASPLPLPSAPTAAARRREGATPGCHAHPQRRRANPRAPAKSTSGAARVYRATLTGVARARRGRARRTGEVRTRVSLRRRMRERARPPLRSCAVSTTNVRAAKSTSGAARGESIEESAIEGAVLRLRPILLVLDVRTATACRPRRCALRATEDSTHLRLTIKEPHRDQVHRHRLN